MDIDKIKELKWGEWFDVPELTKAAVSQHDKNLKACREAIEHWQSKDRPLEILVIHGSLRSSDKSCAREPGNSQLLLEYGLSEADLDEKGINIDRVNLRDFNIDACNGCVSSTSALCGFPCTCHPFDPMQDLYPKLLRSDVIFISTGVNQSMPSGRLANLFPRMISLDGGFLVEEGEYESKTSEYKARMVTLGKTHNFNYDQRMFGRVAGYFISSKDHDNPEGGFPAKMKYGDFVATTLRSNFDDFGIQHADPWYTVFSGKFNEDYSYDKQRLDEADGAKSKAVDVVRAAVATAIEFRNLGYPQPEVGRQNRT